MGRWNRSYVALGLIGLLLGGCFHHGAGSGAVVSEATNAYHNLSDVQVPQGKDSKGFTATSALAPIPSSASSLDQKIDIKWKAIPLAAGLQDLSQKLKVPLSCDSELGHEIMVVDVQKQAAKDLLERVARSVVGVWKPNGTGLKLESDKNLSQADKRAGGNSRTSDWNSFISSRQFALAPLDSSRARAIDQAYGNAELKAVPGSLLARDLLSSLKIDELMKLGPMEAIAVSSNPKTAFCEPLTGDWQMALKRFSANVQAVNAELGSALPVPSPQSGVVVIAGRLNYGDGISVSVILTDEFGKSRGLQGSCDVSFSHGVPEITPADSPQNDGSEPLNLSLEDQAMLAMAGGRNPEVGYSVARGGPAAFFMLSQPLKMEPLSLTAASLFAQYAQANHEQIVADIPDQMDLLLRDLGPVKSMTSMEFVRTLQALGQGVVNHERGWLELDGGVITAVDGRADRVQLQRFVDAARNGLQPQLPTNTPGLPLYQFLGTAISHSPTGSRSGDDTAWQLVDWMNRHRFLTKAPVQVFTGSKLLPASREIALLMAKFPLLIGKFNEGIGGELIVNRTDEVLKTASKTNYALTWKAPGVDLPMQIAVLSETKFSSPPSLASRKKLPPLSLKPQAQAGYAIQATPAAH